MIIGDTNRDVYNVHIVIWWLQIVTLTCNPACDFESVGCRVGVPRPSECHSKQTTPDSSAKLASRANKATQHTA